MRRYEEKSDYKAVYPGGGVNLKRKYQEYNSDYSGGDFKRENTALPFKQEMSQFDNENAPNVDQEITQHSLEENLRNSQEGNLRNSQDEYNNLANNNAQASQDNNYNSHHPIKACYLPSGFLIVENIYFYSTVCPRNLAPGLLGHMVLLCIFLFLPFSRKKLLILSYSFSLVTILF